MEKRREIDFANVCLCVLVMLIHILSRAVGALERESLQYAVVFVPWRLASFVVQGFIFLSAMKYFMKFGRGEQRLDYGGFLVSRIKTIILPYILWNLIYYFTLMPLGYFIFDPAELIGYILRGDMISHFYFVVVIVQFYLLMPLWIWLVRKARAAVLVPLSLIVMIAFGQYLAVGYAYNDRIFLKYIFYWICGCYAGMHYEKVMAFLKKYGFAAAALFVLAAASDAGLTLLNSSGRMYVRGLENIHIVYCSLAVAFIFAASLWKTGKIVDNPVFAMINRQSYNIYLSHCLVLYFADGFTERLITSSQGGILIMRLTCCYGVTFVCWGAYDRVKRLKRAKSGC